MFWTDEAGDIIFVAIQCAHLFFSFSLSKISYLYLFYLLIFILLLPCAMSMLYMELCWRIISGQSSSSSSSSPLVLQPGVLHDPDGEEAAGALVRRNGRQAGGAGRGGVAAVADVAAARVGSRETWPHLLQLE